MVNYMQYTVKFEQIISEPCNIICIVYAIPNILFYFDSDTITNPTEQLYYYKMKIHAHQGAFICISPYSSN